jgi:hypothetical protein
VSGALGVITARLLIQIAHPLRTKQASKRALRVRQAAFQNLSVAWGEGEGTPAPKSIMLETHSERIRPADDKIWIMQVCSLHPRNIAVPYTKLQS